MKHVNTYFKILLLFAVLFCGKANAQVSAFQLNPPSGTIPLGTAFQVGIATSWAPNTISDTVRITFDNTVVSYDASQTFLPAGCMVANVSGSVLTVIAGNLNNCATAGSITVSVGFRFLCPDSCAGVVKNTVFSGTIRDNLGTTIASNCTASGILNNSVTMTHAFSSYNPVTSEVTYRISYNNPNCFKIKSPSFNVVLSPALGPISAVYGSNNTYSFSGYTITPASGVINGQTSDNIYYTIKLPCTTPPSTTINSNVTLRGINCAVANSVIVPAVAALPYTTPATTPVSNPSVTVSGFSNSTYFRYLISNNGNTPLNLTATSYLPAVHLTSVLQQTGQAGISNSVKYFDCALAATTTYTLVGNNATNSNVPANTRRIEQTINNLQPGQYVYLYAYYNTASSCNGAAGTPPFRDSLHVAYSCVAQTSPCIPCGPGGVRDVAWDYNVSPIITCDLTTTMPACKGIGDTILFSYKFRNTGDAALNGGTYNVPLPGWATAVPGSVVYTGFSTNPIAVSSSNLSFTLPSLPVGATVYGISFKAVIHTGAVAGSTMFYSTVTSPSYNASICYTTLKICSISLVNIEKRVRGSLDAGVFSTSGQGAPNTNVDYEIKLFNSGTIAVNNLVVIDRIPAPGNLRIVGSPTISSPVVPNQFNMQMLAAPVSSNYTATYTGTQNACTGWPSTGTNCTSGAVWSSTVASGAVKFTFNPLLEIAPGDSLTFVFQTKIPAGTTNGFSACNTAGFLAVPVSGGALFATESDNACIKAVNPCNTNVTPAFTMSRTCSTGVNVITATALETSTTSHQWFLMQTNVCGNTTDLATAGQIGTTLTGSYATFNLPASGCYYIKHRIFITGCYDTTIRMAIVLPQVTNAFNFEDANGNVKSLFCVGEAVYFDGSASTGESQYSISITRRLVGSLSSFSSFVNLGTFYTQAGVLNLSQLISPQYFTSQYEYSVSFTVSNPGDCIGPVATKQIFKVQCCRDFFNSNFQLGVTPAAGSYTITSALVNVYPYANATSEWYVLSSPNQTGGPYTPVMSATTANFSYAGAQYNLYYTVIHKIKTLCGEVCSTVVQYQSQGRNMQEATSDCCLAFQFWPNGPGESQPFTAEFEIGSTPLGGGQYTIDIYPTFSYSSNPAVTHEWYVLSSPNSSGGPYTAVASATGFDYTFSPANDGLYYFIIHKVNGPCGDVCYGQSMCRNCKAEQCDLCGVIDCKILDEVWPDCYPPINLGNSCRKERLYWDAIPAAGGYQLELDYNDPNCCKSEYLPVANLITIDTNVFQLNSISHPKFNCIRWRVRAKCKDGYSEWSSWSCYYCEEIIFDPFPLTAGNSNNTDAAAQLNLTPEVFPNPNNGDMYLQLKAKGELVLSVEVFNTQGVLVKSIRENKYPDGNFGTKLSLGSNIPKGLYLVVFKTNFGTYNKKVIIN
jgi:uncharacterized repeat protein (TIGR01451 family)